MAERRAPGYMTEDLQPRIAAGAPRYTSRTAKQVEHVALAKRSGERIGYLYANDEDDAAGWIAVAGLTPAGWNLATPWVRILHDATHVVPGSRTTSASLSTLRKIAGYSGEEG
jgi:hypothetical protein